MTHNNKNLRIFLIDNMMTGFIIIGALVVSIISILWFVNQEHSDKDEAQDLLLENIFVFFPDKEISALLFDGEYIWMGGRDGVYLIEPQSGEIVKEIANDIQMTYTAGMCRTKDGSIWIGHENGITIFKDEIRIDYSSPDIPKGRVNSIIEDKEEGVWAGIQSGAAHFILESDCWTIDKILDSNSGLIEDTVNTIGIDSMGGLWFGSYLGKNTGGISILRSDVWEYISVKEGLPHRYVTSIIPIDNEYMLVGVGHLDRGGMALFEKQNNDFKLHATYSVEDGLPGEKIRQLYLDDKKHLWITSESDGLLICDSYEELFNAQLEGIYLTTQNGLSDNEVKVIIEAEGFYWLGGRIGLTRIENTTIEQLFTNRE